MLKNIKNISISDYDYQLCEDQIASHPLDKRDNSKLLIYKNGEYTHSNYNKLPKYLPDDSALFFNNTKVVCARLRFQKSTGGLIEIFCLEPDNKVSDLQIAMSTKHKIRWKCMVGGIKKWKEEYISLVSDAINVQAKIVERLEDAVLIEFNWEHDITFSEVLTSAGEIPLPPYMNRKPEKEDKTRYQTTFAEHEGSVAAPTAGLHFTPNLISEIALQSQINYLTLHVGAGTFKPVKSETMDNHVMHYEVIDVTKYTVQKLLDTNYNIPVGTTSLRTIESLYWIGVLAFENKLSNNEIPELNQWEPYQLRNAVTLEESLNALLTYIGNNDKLIARTQLIIAPGYSFKIANGLITNFHQPKSTLLLIVSAMIGNQWKEMYELAQKENYRFLSYGDGCLILT